MSDIKSVDELIETTGDACQPQNILDFSNGCNPKRRQSRVKWDLTNNVRISDAMNFHFIS